MLTKRGGTVKKGRRTVPVTGQASNALLPYAVLMAFLTRTRLTTGNSLCLRCRLR